MNTVLILTTEFGWWFGAQSVSPTSLWFLMQGFPGPYTSGQWRNRHQQPYYFSLPIKCVGLDEPVQTYCTAVPAVWHHSVELELVQDLLWQTVSPTWISCKWCLTHVCKLLHISCVGFTHWLEVLVLMYSFSLCDLWDLIGTGLFLLLFMIEMNISTSVDSGGDDKLY